MKRAGDHSVLMRHRWVLIGALLSATSSVPARAAAGSGVLPYTTRIWQTDDGLPQNSVFALAQTSDGYLWVGTREGLARFDGERFTSIGGDTAPELHHAWITALCVSRDGTLWIGTDANGLVSLKAGEFRRLRQADGLPSNQARSLLEARDGSLWIGTEGGLARYRAGQITRFTTRDGLGDNSIRALWQEEDQTVLVATKRGLTSLKTDGTIVTTNFPGGWNRNALRAVRQDRHGTIWVGATDGLIRLEGDQDSFYDPARGLPDRVINAIYEDRASQLWVATYGGLARLIDGRVIPRSNRDGPFGDLVYTILEDREDNLWLGGRDGLYQLNPARFKTYTTQEGLTGNNVMSVLEDDSSRMWLGIWGGGLNCLQGDRVESYPTTNLVRDPVLALHRGRDGTLWIGMDFGDGLYVLRDGQRVAVPKPDGWGGAPIRVIHEDRQGTLWIGTSAGLNAFKNGEFQLFTSTNGLVADSVLSLLEDSAGCLWIGTEGGLSCRVDGQFTNYTTADGLPNFPVNALYEDSAHCLWLGTKGGGLVRFQSGRFTAYTTEEGLFSDEVYEILEDDLGYFWMSCRRGIFRVARQDLDEVDQGTRNTIACTAFGKADGLRSVQCNGVAKPSGWKSRDGRLWFPTIRGVVAVESRIDTNDKPPPVVIEEVWADQARLFEAIEGAAAEPDPQSTIGDSTAPLTISPGRGEIEIVYTALSLQAPEKNHFRYMLEPADSTWKDAGTQRSARYNNLAPGSYRFRVIAANNDGVWNATGASLSLVLLPHYWQTWWFKAVVALAVVLLLTAAYRYRVGRFRQLERLRVEIAANLHDDVGARLTKLGMISESMDQETNETNPIRPHIQAISRTTREVIQAMDEIVWTINPKNDTLDNLANYVFQYAQEYFQNTGVRCRLDLPAQLPDYAISTEVRHNIFLAIKEALNNVLKHACATEVRLSLAVADSALTLTIKDNGRGFSRDQVPSTGNGLQNMKERMEHIGGRFVLESAPGAGTSLKMVVEVG